MKESLSRIPNYTCLETISRGSRPPQKLESTVSGKHVPVRHLDVLRLEVAEVGDDELFARPGEHEFQRRQYMDLVKGGLMGSGMFSGFAHDVFSSKIAVIQFAGETMVDGRKLVRYTFRIPRSLSGYRVGSVGQLATVGYHGTFWADPETHEAVSLETVADDVPPHAGLSGVSNRVEFARVRIGDSDALLCAVGRMVIVRVA
jgi:hypothetical protein